MKRSLIAILVLIFLIFQNVAAVEVDLKEQYSNGETLIAKVTGTFVSPITKENIFFYREHTRIPMNYEIEGAEGRYYIYAILAGKSAGNYSISIENAQYSQGDKIAKEKITRNFSILETASDFSVSPGFVFPSGDFYIEVKNLQENEISLSIKTNSNDSLEREISIYSSDGLSEEANFSLISGESKNINFKINSGAAAIKKISLQAGGTYYEIPVILSSSEGFEESTFSLEPSKFISSLPTNSQVKRTFYIYNNGNSEIKNISLYLSDSLKSVANLSAGRIEKLGAGANMPFEIILFSGEEKYIEGDLKAKTGETIAYSSISVDFINDYVVPENYSGQSSDKTCSELGGVICNSEGVECSEKLIESKDGFCCKGKCSSVSAGSAGKIIAVVIIIFLIAAGLWFYFKKYKKAKKPVDLVGISKVKEI